MHVVCLLITLLDILLGKWQQPAQLVGNDVSCSCFEIILVINEKIVATAS